MLLYYSLLHPGKRFENAFGARLQRLTKMSLNLDFFILLFMSRKTLNKSRKKKKEESKEAQQK